MKLRTSQQIEAAIKSAPLEDRQTLRTTAASSGVPKTTLVRHMKTIGNLRGLYEKLKEQLEIETFNKDNEEEFEDSEGNVFNRKTYEDLARQGLL
ncbi:hypothetical protein Ae201684_010021 [Aphanomyces euteiches]|uniref:Splicing factor SF3a60 /Prp9 subunit C-terminal domain-containing protein n=1 Tax=Aphanomyces euteiches TaxID=100861 RepID=A0A6G0X028_9STRA|nr:hypothetical protein Ae201684_010021 [Aphanomyces euteiches]